MSHWHEVFMTLKHLEWCKCLKKIHSIESILLQSNLKALGLWQISYEAVYTITALALNLEIHTLILCSQLLSMRINGWFVGVWAHVYTYFRAMSTTTNTWITYKRRNIVWNARISKSYYIPTTKTEHNKENERSIVNPAACTVARSLAVQCIRSANTYSSFWVLLYELCRIIQFIPKQLHRYVASHELCYSCICAPLCLCVFAHIFRSCTLSHHGTLFNAIFYIAWIVYTMATIYRHTFYQ